MEISRNWRLQEQRYKLVGESCPKGHRNFPPRRQAPCLKCTQENYDLEHPTPELSAIALIQPLTSNVDP